MTEHAVVIAGGGPTGLMLAAELKIAGVDALIVEPRADHYLDSSRGRGLLSRTIEVLDQRGVAERFLSAGQTHTMYGFGGVPMDVSDLPTRHSYVLGLLQSEFEPLFGQWVIDELGARIARGVEVVGFDQNADGVGVVLSDGRSLRAEYLVGCDGGRSFVRKHAGIDLVGLDATTSWMIAECFMDDPPETGFVYDEVGSHAVNRMNDEGLVGVVLTERPPQEGTPTIDDLRAALVRVYGRDVGLRDAHWVSRFTDATRQAATYRNGRVLVAGDAAHVHPPQGGQGMGTGLQDAVNLGWKLAQVVHGYSPESLLDTYEAERHPVAARVLQNTQAQVVLTSPDPRHQSVKAMLASVLVFHQARHQVYAMLSALDLHYGDNGDAHPLVGRRVPDLDIATADGPTQIFALLHAAQPVLLNLGEAGAFDSFSAHPRLRVVDAICEAPWDLPVIGVVEAPPAVLIRPDGYVAWVGEAADPAMPDAIARWFGAS